MGANSHCHLHIPQTVCSAYVGNFLQNCAGWTTTTVVNDRSLFCEQIRDPVNNDKFRQQKASLYSLHSVVKVRSCRKIHPINRHRFHQVTNP